MRFSNEKEVPLLIFPEEYDLLSPFTREKISQPKVEFPSKIYYATNLICYIITCVKHYRKIPFTYINNFVYLGIVSSSLWVTSPPRVFTKKQILPLSVCTIACSSVWSGLEDLKSLQDLKFDSSLASFSDWSPPAQITLVTVSTFILLNSLYHIYLAKLQKVCLLYTFSWISIIGALSVLPIFYSVHLHHWIISYILVNFCRFPNMYSLVIRFGSMGVLVEAITRWGPAPLIVGS